MNKYIENRVIKEANFFIESKKTLRELANDFNLSKSTIHKDFQERLPKISYELYEKVHAILTEHLNTRHIKGGESTKIKYQTR